MHSSSIRVDPDASSPETGDGAIWIDRAQPLLGTFVSIRVEAAARALAARAIDAAFASIAAVQRTMSFHDPASELSRINRSAWHEPQPASPSLLRVLRASLALARATGGRFDPTVGWRLVASGHLPAPAAIDVDPAATWKDVHVLPGGRVQFARALWLDFGGIAKGYAVDQAVRTLRARGVAAGCVNAGGDLRVFGLLETVHVRDPADPRRSLPILNVRDGAVATSAGYFSASNGRTALVSPADGASIGQTTSATVCAPRAIWADALTKLVMGSPSSCGGLLRRLHASALLIACDGSRRRIG